MTRPPRASPRKKDRLVAVTLDEASIGRSNRDVEHERAVAIYDLLEDNTFAPNEEEEQGPFALHLSITGARLPLTARTRTRIAAASFPFCKAVWPRGDRA